MLIDTEKLKGTITKHCDYLNCRMLDLDELFEMIDNEPDAEKHGEWRERKIIDAKGCGIEELQSERCSNCGLYLTTPYMYYFFNHNYCPHCGVRMDRVNEEKH